MPSSESRVVTNGPTSPAQRTCTVSLQAAPDGPYYTHTTMGSSLFQAVQRAIDFFHSEIWYGPRPGPETVFLVRLVADDRRFYEKASTVMGR